MPFLVLATVNPRRFQWLAPLSHTPYPVCPPGQGVVAFSKRSLLRIALREPVSVIGAAAVPETVVNASAW